jgi:hypothetical protein
MNKVNSTASYFSITTLVVISLFFTNQIKADTKFFARSYTAYTLPAKALELEFWQTGRFDKGLGNYYRWQPRMEVEYGVTDRLTAAMYMNFNEVKSTGNNIPSQPLSLSTTSFEFRYRLTNPSEYFIDPALYFELSYGGDKIEYEPKILFTKRFEKFISVMNINSEIERDIAGKETESAFELTLGLAYELNKNFSIGLEFRNDRNFKEVYEKEENQASFIGPTINFRSDRIYFVINFLAQVGGSPATNNNLELSSHEKYEIRTILGIEL